MPNSYNSEFTGAHNDEYNTRIEAIENMINLLNAKQNITTKTNTIVKIPETIATTASDGMQTILTYIANHYPGYTYTWFLGEFSQSGNGWFFILVYNTSALTDGFIDYAWGMAGMVAHGYPIYAHKGMTPRYTWFTGGNYGIQKWAATTLNASTTSTSKSISITTHGRPVFLSITGDLNPSATESTWIGINLYRGSTQLTHQDCVSNTASANNPFVLNYLDAVAAGTYTYQCTISRGAGTCNLSEGGAIEAPQFIAFEI